MFSEKRFINYTLKIRGLRRKIMLAVFTLTGLGILFVYDVSSVYGWWNYSDSAYFLKRHCLFIALGIVSMFAALRVNLDFLRRHSKLLAAIALFLLVLVLVIGTRAGGARRWFRILGFSIQPSEFAKIIYILYAADFLSRKRRHIRSFMVGIFPLLIVTGLFSGLILMEPDLGNAALICGLMFALLFVSGMPWRYIAGFAGSGAALLAGLILTSPYRMARVMSFLDPWADALGSGFQLAQSNIAVGSGGLLGVGLGNSMQKLFFLPAIHTDFIFAVIGEELGFIGSCAVMGLYFFVFTVGLRLVKTLEEGSFNYYVCVGGVFLYIIEACLNFSVVTGLMPTKGLPLPFISYGGSATVANFIMLGLLFNAAKESEYI